MHNLKGSLELVFECADEVNKYVDTMAPWKLSIENDSEHDSLDQILFRVASDLRYIALMLLPFFPVKMRELLNRIGTPYDDTHSLTQNLQLPKEQFLVTEKGEPLYMRVSN